MDNLTIATLVLAVVTLALVGVTVWLVVVTRGAATRQLGIETWLHFVSRFDSKEMRQARKTLAALLENYGHSKHDKINETVLDFFEDVGAIYAEGCINKKLAVSSFSYYANYWWEAAKGYVDQERRNKGGDGTFFEDFERLSNVMRASDTIIDSERLENFFSDEKRLKLD